MGLRTLCKTTVVKHSSQYPQLFFEKGFYLDGKGKVAVIKNKLTSRVSSQ